jgi:branched-chain amino acid transport system permease protein
MLLQLIVQGLATGAVYALVGLGFSLVFRSINQVIFSQGHVFMFGSIIGYIIVSRLDLGPVPALLLIGLVGFGLGWLMDRIALRKLHNADHLTFIIATIGIGIILENGVRIFYPEPLRFPPIFGSSVLDIGGVRIAEPYTWVVAVSLILVALLHLFFTYSRVGRGLRAVASDKPIASIMGVNVTRSITLTIAISTAVAAIGGVLIGPIYYVSFDVGGMVGLKAFSAAVLGGINSIPGAIIGGFLLGVLENLSAGYISSGYKDAVAFAVLIIMLLIRPNGILGTTRPTKV